MTDYKTVVKEFIEMTEDDYDSELEKPHRGKTPLEAYQSGRIDAYCKLKGSHEYQALQELQDRYNALDSLLASTLETNQALGKRLREGVDMLPELIELLDELTTKQHFGESAKEMIAKLNKWRDG